MVMREDSAYFYNLRGVLIILVVLGHVIEQFYFAAPAIGWFYKQIYFFHMPLFVTLAGYFSATEARLAKLVQGLLVPYVVGQVFYAVSDHLLFGADMINALLKPNWGMWFLICLFIWRAVWPFAHKLPFLLPTAIVLAITCGYVDNLDPTLSRAIVFFPFFIIGWRWSVRGARGPEFPLSQSATAIVLIACLIAQSVFLSGDFAPQWLYGKFSYSTLAQQDWWAGGIRLAALAAAGGGILLCLATTTAREGWLTRIGKYSLVTYLGHFFLIDLLKAFDVPAEIASLANGYWMPVILVSALVTAATIAVLNIPAVQTGAGFLLQPHRASQRETRQSSLSG